MSRVKIFKFLINLIEILIKEFLTLISPVILVQRQTPSVQVFNRFGSGMLSFQYIFLSTNNICPIVVSYFPVSVLASMHACAVCS